MTRPYRGQYLGTSDVADLFHVSPITVARWAAAGKLPHTRTIGGHRRYPADDIRKLAASLTQAATDTTYPGSTGGGS